MQDSDINGHPIYADDVSGAGPMEAILEFVASDHRFQVDRSRERLLFTMNPRGFLRRVE